MRKFKFTSTTRDNELLEYFQDFASFEAANAYAEVLINSYTHGDVTSITVECAS